MASAAVSPPAAPSLWARIQDLIVPIGMIASILVVMVPLPADLMDFLLSGNITIAVIMLLTTMYVRTPLEFSIFPSLLLATTLFRLVLNVATTRLILTRAADDGLEAAGGVVRTFGQFVTGGGGDEHIVVGLVIFSIIVLIQFVVITKGATRISEVTARFTLDGMPGKQMAIDADLGAGLIDQREARRRRQEVAGQADFFGAMDGASKFVRGDAIAGIAIILINIIGGLWIGIVQHGMSIGTAGRLFTTLTIGDGLVTQVPALLISLAAALLVTRSSQESNLPKDVLQQLSTRPQVLAIAGGFLAVLIFTSLPRLPLLLIGGGCLALAVTTGRRRRANDAAAKQAEQSKGVPRVEDYLAIDPMELELGVGLIRLADTRRGGDLLERIGRLRQTVAAQIGIVLPKVRVRDNMRLGQNQYQIRIADMPVAQGVTDNRSGDQAAAVVAHLGETVRKHADELLTRSAVKHLIDQVRQTSPATVDELVPALMKLGEVQQVLQLLLREMVPIRQLGLILESLGDCAPRSKDATVLAEYVRQRLARTICSHYLDREKQIHVVTLDPTLEEWIRAGALHSDDGLEMTRSPREVETVCRSIEAEVAKLTTNGRPPIVLVSPPIRPTVKVLTAAHLPQLAVLSYNEITPDVKIRSVAMVAGISGQNEVASGQWPVANDQSAAGIRAPHFSAFSASGTNH